MKENSQLVLGVDRDCIYVNNEDLRNKHNITESQLNFQLLNPSRFNKIVFENKEGITSSTILSRLLANEVVSDVSYLQFIFPIGDKNQDFIDENNAELLDVEIDREKWSCSNPSIIDGYLCYIVSCLNESELGHLTSLSVKFKNIISFAEEGQTYFIVGLKNVLGVSNMTKTIPIQKKKSYPKIRKFMSDSTTFAMGEKTDLQWSFSNDNSAELQPGNIIISNTTNQDRLTVEVFKNKEYQLTVFDNYDHDTASLNVYVSPPKIVDFSFCSQTNIISWNIKYARKITLITLQEEILDVAQGSKEVEVPPNKQIAIRVEGIIYNEVCVLQVAGLYKKDNFLLQMNCRELTEYTYTKLSWSKIDGEKGSGLLKFTEWYGENPPYFEHTVKLTQHLEYVSSKEVVAAILGYKSSEGDVEYRVDMIGAGS